MNTQLNEFSKGTIVVQFDHEITIKAIQKLRSYLVIVLMLNYRYTS